MPALAIADATVAAMVSNMPQFKDWHNQPLSPVFYQHIHEADKEQLMTIAIESLRLLALRSSDVS